VNTTLIGVDPGVVDTGAVVIMLRPSEKTFTVFHRVWRNVSSKVNGEFIVDPEFLKEIREFASDSSPRDKTLRFVEGYRNRGRDSRQDQQMTVLVQEIVKVVKGSTIVDNTGIKKVVKPGFMDLFGFTFPGTHHADLWSAARVALKGGLSDLETNTVLSNLTRDALDGTPWGHV